LGLGAIPFTRDVLKKYVLPAAGEGPSEEDRESGYFNISILGFKEKISEEASIQVNVFGKRDPRILQGIDEPRNFRILLIKIRSERGRVSHKCSSKRRPL
jgi:hypothetical protein